MHQIHLDNRVVVVTGASLGLGRAMSNALAQAGARIVLAAPELELLQQVAEEIGRSCGPGRCLALRTDITQPNDCERVLSESLRAFGGVDMLVNNARKPYKTRIPFWQADADAWRHTIEVNVNGMFLMTRTLVPSMIARGSGRIVNIGTSLSTMQTRNYSQYGASKSAIEAATIIWAQDLQGTGVTVNSLNPGGMVDTGQPLAPELRDNPALPVDVMNAAIVWLASDLSAGKTGGRYCGRLWDAKLQPAAAAAGALEAPVLRVPGPME
jgi:NAD(P)-dependent dehydrogenase (short-subunit alcohol dehydrogenase family)